MLNLGLPCSQMLSFYEEFAKRLGLSVAIKVTPGAFRLEDGACTLFTQDSILFYLLRKADQLPSDAAKLASISELHCAISDLQQVLLEISVQQSKTAKYAEEMFSVAFECMSRVDAFLAGRTCFAGICAPVDFYFAKRLEHLLSRCEGDFENVRRYVRTHLPVSVPARFLLKYDCECQIDVFTPVFARLGMHFDCEKAQRLELCDGPVSVSGLQPVLFYVLRAAEQLPQRLEALARIDSATQIISAACELAQTIKEYMIVPNCQEMRLNLLGPLKNSVSMFADLLKDEFFIQKRDSAVDAFCASALAKIISIYYNKQEAEQTVANIMHYCQTVLGEAPTFQ